MSKQQPSDLHRQVAADRSEDTLANTIKYEALWKEMGHERIKLQIRKRKWSWLGDTL